MKTSESNSWKDLYRYMFKYPAYNWTNIVLVIDTFNLDIYIPSDYGVKRMASELEKHYNITIFNIAADYTLIAKTFNNFCVFVVDNGLLNKTLDEVVVLWKLAGEKEYDY